MIIYFIEFFILHLLFFGIYKVMLSKETQLGFLRFFLVGSTILSMTLPIIEIPTKSSIPSLNTETIILPMITTTISEEASGTPWYFILLSAISTVFIFKLFLNLIQVYGWYHQSETDTLDKIDIRKVAGLQNSFTFFQWIFIDPKNFENPGDIIRHELGHAKKLHSLDLLFFHVLLVFFWWSPSIWLMIKELKTVHEFEADQYALGINDKTYRKTLVHCTLKAHGMDLASSFDDAPIFNRLNFMKKMKRKISIWKVASVATLVAVSGAMFACEEELEAEIEEIVEESSQQIEYSDHVKAALLKLETENPGQKYAVIETKFENQESINRLNAYDPNQIEHIFVNKEGEDKSVVMIVNQSSELFDKAIEIQEVKSSEVFTIVEKPAGFPGGLDAFTHYMSKNLKYPQQAQRLGVEGRVFVQFIVEKDGSLSDVHVVKGIGAGCDTEAKRIVEDSPNWTPGEIDGKPVRMKMVQNIYFKLPG